MKRFFKYSVVAVIVLASGAYGLDGLLASFRKPEFSTVKVDQVYAITNRWNNVDYSIGKTQDQRCVHAMFPHGGAQPCWYLNDHTLNITHGGD